MNDQIRKILITGGAGFVGSALAARLSHMGQKVIAIDNFNEYYDPRMKQDRVKNLLPNVPMVRMDLNDRPALNDLFEMHGFDVVCHLAAQAGVRYSVDAPHVYIDTNVSGTGTLLEVMKDHGVKRHVFASTSSVYGTDTPVPFQESAPADHPVSIYAATKRAGELLSYTYYVQYGIETTCLRFFTVYGPWSRPDMAMLKFARQMTNSEPIDVYNHGDLRRDFTYIDDIVDGFVRAVAQPLGYEILNLGNGHPVELMTLIERMEKEFGVPAEKNMLPMQPGDVYETFADTTKAERLLGFKAKVGFDVGVKNFVDWYREYYRN